MYEISFNFVSLEFISSTKQYLFRKIGSPPEQYMIFITTIFVDSIDENQISVATYLDIRKLLIWYLIKRVLLKIERYKIRSSTLNLFINYEQNKFWKYIPVYIS